MADDEEAPSDKDVNPWIITERRSLEDLSIPIKLAKSVQFTTIKVSRSYIWCGSNRSSLYVFDLKTLKHVYLIPMPSAMSADVHPVTQLSVYHTEQLCAVAIGSQVYTSSIHSGTTKKPDIVEALKAESDITQFVWHSSSSKLYVGDNTGGIYICSFLTIKMIPRSSVLCRLDSCIVQLDFSNQILLASTFTKCSAYHTERKTLKDIGKKARNGYYGAVLLPAKSEDSSADTKEPVCYCARPGLRLWRADVDGKVLATLNFKQALAECPPCPIYSHSESIKSSDSLADVSKISSFSHLRYISERYILSVGGKKIVVMDPATSQVIASTHVDQGIVSCCVVSNRCYFISGEAEVRCVELSTVTDYLESLLKLKTISQAIEFALNFQNRFQQGELLLGRLEELIPLDHEQYQVFSEVFSVAIESYRALASRRSSRSSTVSSVSCHVTSGSHASDDVSQDHQTLLEADKLYNTIEISEGIDVQPEVDQDILVKTAYGDGRSEIPEACSRTCESSAVSSEGDNENIAYQTLCTSDGDETHTTIQPMSSTDVVGTRTLSHALSSIEKPQEQTLSQPQTNIEGPDAPTPTQYSSSSDGPHDPTPTISFSNEGPHVPISTQSSSNEVPDVPTHTQPSSCTEEPNVTSLTQCKMPSTTTPDVPTNQPLSSSDQLDAHNCNQRLSSSKEQPSTQATATSLSPSTSPTKSSVSRHDSSKSLTSLDSMQAEHYHRRGSHTSVSSFDQSGEFSEYSTRQTKGKGRRIRPSTIMFPGSEKDKGDESDDETTLVYPRSSSIPISGSSSKQSLSMSNKSFSSPASSPVHRELSSPGSVVEHVRDVKEHVKDGLSKISTQAKSFISTIKERTISQPVIEKILSASNKDDSTDGSRSHTPATSNENSGSHQVFFIGDDEINMNDEMPSILSPFLELTESTYSRLIDPFNLFTNDQQIKPQYSKWSEKLCHLLSQYTRTGGKSVEGKVLRSSTRICPWRMSTQLTSQCEYLATLCVLQGFTHPLLDYTIDRETESNSRYSIPDQTQVSQYEDLQRDHMMAAGLSVVSNGSVSSQYRQSSSTPSVPLVTSDQPSQTDHDTASTADNDSTPVKDGEVLPTESSLEEAIQDDNSLLVENKAICKSTLLVCQSMSSLWFLMNTKELCTHVEQLSAVNVNAESQKVIWASFINCLVGNAYDRLEWQPVFHTSIFTTSDLGKQLLKHNDKAGLWLIVYVLMRQQQFEEAISIALNSHMQVPPIHVLYCLQFTCELDKLVVLTAQQLFAGYIQSLIQRQEVSARSLFVKKCFTHSELLNYWLACLESSWNAGGDNQQQLCSCGQPVLLCSEPVVNNLQITLSDIISLLEENLLAAAGVQSTILRIGGSTALLRQKIRDDERNDVLKLSLLASDLSVLHQNIGKVELSSEDCLYLLKQRAVQQTDTEGKVCCLWCGEVYSRTEALLTWDSLAEFIMERLGPEACMDVLIEACLPDNSVSHQFYALCAMTHENNLNSSQLVSDAIDGLERFLWSNELADKTCDSRMYQLMQKEAELTKLLRDGQPISDSDHDQLSEMSDRLGETESLRTIEDTDVHWGAIVKLSDECYHCGLQLSQANMNVTVFQCGHCAHQNCCQTAAGCLQCHLPMGAEAK